MKIIALLLISFLWSCSSYERYSTGLKYDVVISVDPYNKAIIVDYNYENGIQQYKQMIKDGRINSLAEMSCFQSSSSVNYVDMIEPHIKFYRSLHVDEHKTVKYSKVDGSLNDHHARVYREISSDEIEFQSKKCLIGDYYVVSEIYL